MYYFKDHFSLFWWYFLNVSWFDYCHILIIFQMDVFKLFIRHILDINPLDFNLAFELVCTGPITTSGIVVVHGTHHFRHTTETTGAFDGKKQKDRSLTESGSLGLKG